MADFNIYDDLEVLDAQEKQKAAEELQWKEKYEVALETIEKLQNEKKELNKKIKQLEQNFTSLLDTARSEIKRKDNQIAELRKEKDNICFRRNIRSGKNPFADNSGGEDSRRVGDNAHQFEHRRSSIAEASGSVNEQIKASSSRQKEPERNSSKFDCRDKFAERHRERERSRVSRERDRQEDRNFNDGPTQSDPISSQAKSSDSNREKNDAKDHRHLHRVDYSNKNDYVKEKHHKDKSDLHHEQKKDVPKEPIPKINKSNANPKKHTSFIENKETDKLKITCLEEDILKDVKELKKKKKSKVEEEPLSNGDLVSMAAEKSNTFLDALFDDMLMKTGNEPNDLYGDLETSETTSSRVDVEINEICAQKIIAKTDVNCNLEMQLRTPTKQTMNTLFDELFGPSPAPSTIGFERINSSSSIYESVSDFTEIVPVTAVDETVAQRNHLNKETLMEEDSPSVDSRSNDNWKNEVNSQNSSDQNEINQNSVLTLKTAGIPSSSNSSFQLTKDDGQTCIADCNGVQREVETSLFETYNLPFELGKSSVKPDVLKGPCSSLIEKADKKDKVITDRGKQDSFGSKFHETTTHEIQNAVPSVSKHRTDKSRKELVNNTPKSDKKNGSHSVDPGACKTINKEEEPTKKDSHRHHHHSSSHHRGSSSSKSKFPNKDSHRTEKSRSATLDSHHHNSKQSNDNNPAKIDTGINSSSHGIKKSSKDDRHRSRRETGEKGENRQEKCSSKLSQQNGQEGRPPLKMRQPTLEEENSSDLKLFQDQNGSLHCDDISDEEGIEVNGESFPTSSHSVDGVLDISENEMNLHVERIEGVELENAVASITNESEKQMTHENMLADLINQEAKEKEYISTECELGIPIHPEFKSSKAEIECISVGVALSTQNKLLIRPENESAVEDVCNLSKEEQQLKEKNDIVEKETVDNAHKIDSSIDLTDEPKPGDQRSFVYPSIDDVQPSKPETNEENKSLDSVLHTDANEIIAKSMQNNCTELKSNAIDVILDQTCKPANDNQEENESNFIATNSSSTSGENTQLNLSTEKLETTNEEAVEITTNSAQNKSDRFEGLSEHKCHPIAENTTETIPSVPIADVADKNTNSHRTSSQSHSSSSNVNTVAPVNSELSDNKEEAVFSGRRRKLKTPRKLSDEENNLNDSARNSTELMTNGIEHRKSPILHKTQAESMNSGQSQNLFRAERNFSDAPKMATTESLSIEAENRNSPSTCKAQVESIDSGQTQNLFGTESNDPSTSSTILLITEAEHRKSPNFRKTHTESANCAQTQDSFEAESNFSDSPKTSTTVPSTTGTEPRKSTSIRRTHTESTNSVEIERNSNDSATPTLPVPPTSGTEHGTSPKTVLSANPSDSNNQTDSEKIKNIFVSENNFTDSTPTVIEPLLAEINHTKSPIIHKTRTESTPGKPQNSVDDNSHTVYSGKSSTSVNMDIVPLSTFNPPITAFISEPSAKNKSETLETSEKRQVLEHQKDERETVAISDSSNVNREPIKPPVPKSDGKIHHKKRILQHTTSYIKKEISAYHLNEPTTKTDTISTTDEKNLLANHADQGLTNADTCTTNDVQTSLVPQIPPEMDANAFVGTSDTKNITVDATIEKQNRIKSNDFGNVGLNDFDVTMARKNKNTSEKNAPYNSKETISDDTKGPSGKHLQESPSTTTNDSVEIASNHNRKYKKRILQHFNDSNAKIAISSCATQINDPIVSNPTDIVAKSAVKVVRCDIKRKRTAPKINKAISSEVKEQHDGQVEMKIPGPNVIQRKHADSEPKITAFAEQTNSVDQHEDIVPNLPTSEAIETVALDPQRSLIISVAKIKLPVNNCGKIVDEPLVTQSSSSNMRSSSLGADDIRSHSKTNSTKGHKKICSQDSLRKEDDKDTIASSSQHKTKTSTRTKRTRKLSPSTSGTANETEEFACSKPKKPRKSQNYKKSTNDCDIQSPSISELENEQPEAKSYKTVATPTHHQIFSNDIFPEDQKDSLPLVYNSNDDDAQYAEIDNRMRSMFQSPAYVYANSGCSLEADNNTSIEIDGDTVKGNVTIDETLNLSEKSQCDTSSSRKISFGSNNYVIETVGALTANVFITRKKSKKRLKIPKVKVQI